MVIWYMLNFSLIPPIKEIEKIVIRETRAW